VSIVERSRVFLRADASAELGIGHVQRCLALAEALRTAGFEPILLTRNLGVDTDALARARDVEVQVLPTCSPTAPPDMATDAEQTCAALRDEKMDWVVVDRYEVDARWHIQVARALGVRVAAIDDLADRDLAVDLLVDPNPAWPDHRAKYTGRLTRPTRLLGGPRFALLGAVYAQAQRHQVSENVRSIGIFVGGTDPAGLTEVAIRATCDLASFRGAVEVVTTRGNPRWAEVQRLATRRPNVRVLLDLPDLAEFFARHDLHIGAGGGATWERCCVGGPTLALVAADNQRAVVPVLSSLGAVAALPAGAQNAADVIACELRALMDDPERRRALVQRARTLVDGRGALRVALSMGAARLQVRRVTIDDSRLMHDWRNAPATRAVSTGTDEIPLSSHEQWLRLTIGDSQRLLLMGQVGSVPVGVIRFDATESAMAVSLYLDPELHGLGLGGHLLAKGEEAARLWTLRQGRQPAFSATVLPNNETSRRMFEGAGYQFAGNCGVKAATR
jgi:UDP-2,4-diacetamido-2,4,6-trideoxy-beta-L-altropyranose hydrolase